MDRGSDLTAGAAPRPRRDLQFLSVWMASELDRQMRELGTELGPVWFWTNSFAVSRVAQPNGSRLSCGALLERSQTDGLHSKTAPPASSAC